MEKFKSISEPDDNLIRMPSTISESDFRNAINDLQLKVKVQHIWDTAYKELHPFQQGITAQDSLHCLRVEENIWRLIRQHLDKFNPIDLFLLSASAALHDIGKIPTTPIGQQQDFKQIPEDHGEKAKILLLKEENWRNFHLDRKVEAEAIANIISVHNNGLIDKLPDEAFSIGSDSVKLRSLAAIFRLADMLDSDSRRWPYLAKIIKELKFPNKVEVWLARRSIGGWKVSSNGNTSLLQASPDDEEDKICTLSQVDLLNEDLKPPHVKYLENCPVEYYKDNKVVKDTLHFPSKFMYCEFEGPNCITIDGLKSYYSEVATEYIDKAEMIFSGFTLKGIGDFSDKKNLKLSNIFIDAHVSLNVDLAPSISMSFNGNTQTWINDHMPKDNVTKRIQTRELLDIPNLKRIVLLGGPGSGKSVASQYLMVNRLTLTQSSNQVSGVPFLITIREFAFARKSKDINIIDYITQQVCYFTDKQPPQGFVEYFLKRDSSVVIFDGLDEVIVPEERRIIRDSIANFAASFPEVIMLVTSRFIGYDEMPLNKEIFLHFILHPFDSQEKKAFITKWYGEREANPVDRERAIKGFLEALKDDRVDELSSNPLMLTIMALVHNSEHDLPKQRALLYKKCVEAFIVSREKAKELLSYNAREIWECHDYLGYWVQNKAENMTGVSFVVSSEELQQALTDFIKKKNGAAKIDDTIIKSKVDEFITAAKRRVGLIAEYGESRWGFGHKSFQEFFAARYISQRTSGILGIWDEIKDKVDNPHWTEPIKLLAGICGDFSPKLLQDLVDKLMEEHFIVADSQKKRLILAGEIAGEIELEPVDQEKIAKEIVNQFVNIEDSNVLFNLKGVLNNFYNNKELWEYMSRILKERTLAFRDNPFYYSNTAFYGSYCSRRFADTRIDRVISTL